MVKSPIQIAIHSPEEMARLGAQLSRILSSNDTVLIKGDLGAGKTLLCRHLILGRLSVPEDIPSPSFALIQTYDGKDGEIWHCDLYRLNSPDALWELGLEDAFGNALCLVEWPDRLGDLRPKNAWEIEIFAGTHEDSRDVKITSPETPTIRSEQIDWFFSQTIWGDAERSWLKSDASKRRYARLEDKGKTAMLMDANPEFGEDVTPFISVAKILRHAGIQSPEIIAKQTDLGFLILEDFGDALFDTVINTNPQAEVELYHAAVSVLDRTATADYSTLPEYGPVEMTSAASVVTKWYAPGRDLISKPLLTALHALDWTNQVLVHRDFHAQNLIWRATAQGIERVGVLDFQDAARSHPVYDLVSLLFDARRDVSAPLRNDILTQQAQRSALSVDAYYRGVHTIAAQRNLRILGVFARLSKRDGKAHYVNLIPRVWAHLLENLSHPDLAELRLHILETLPAPSAEFLNKLRDPC